MRRLFRKTPLLVILGQPVLLASLGTSMANLALPALTAQFPVTFAEARWVVIAYLLTTTAFSLAVGWVSDRYGRRQTLLAGMAVFAAATLISTVAPSFWVLVLARALQGAGAAALVVLPLAIVTGALPATQTGRAVGTLATMSAVGTMSGPSIGGMILQSLGWRPIFLTMALLAVVSFGFLLSLPAQEGERTGRRPQAKAAWLNPSLKAQLVYNFAVSSVMITTLVIGPFFLTYALHVSPAWMGILMSAGPVTSILSGPLAGWAADRLGVRLVTALGFTQLILGATAFVFLPVRFGAAGFALAAVLTSLGYQLFLSANSSSVMKSVPAEARGVASGWLNFSRNLGLIGGTFFAGRLFDFVAGQSGYVKGLQSVFFGAAIALALSLISFLFTQQRRTDGKGLIEQIH